MIYITGDTHGLQDYCKLHIFAGEHPGLTKDETAEYKHWYFGHFHTDAEPGGRYTALYQDIKRIE